MDWIQGIVLPVAFIATTAADAKTCRVEYLNPDATR